MAWNQPGDGNKNHDHWGNKKNQGPPDLDKLIRQFFNKMRQLFSKNSFSTGTRWQPTFHHEWGVGVGLIAFIISLIWILSGLYIINPAEEAVILRFGQYANVAQPGLHWMARFIDTKYVVNVQKIYSFALQGDFLTKSSDQADMPNQVQTTLNQRMPINSLDKSKNLVSVELNVQYQVTEPRAYLFNVVNPDDTVKQVAAGALSDVIGQMKLDDVLTTGREYLSSGVLERLKEILSHYDTGLSVVSVTLRKVTAPDQVKVAFNDVNRADQDKATYIQQAQAYASKVVPLAQGVAASIQADALGYQQKVVLTAQARIARFRSLLNAYKLAPDVTRQRLYLETMQQVFKRTSKVLVDANSGTNVLYLPIDKFAKLDRAQSLPIQGDSGNMATSNPGNTAEMTNNANQPVVGEVK